MQNSEPVCYITYAVPVRLMPQLSMQEIYVPESVSHCSEEENLPTLYPPGFMPDWFLSGSFPEDDFED